MRTPLFIALGLVAVVGAMGVRSAIAVDEHAGHHTGPMAALPQQEGIPASGMNVEARLAASPRRGEWVTIKVSPTDSVVAWVVQPAGTARAPVVIALHENMGLTTWARGVADQLAADGFIGIAPDLTTMHRTGNLHSDARQDEGRAGIQALTPERVQTYLDAVAKYGMSLPRATQKYGIVGFCWGGGNSFNHAVHSPTLGASVVYYGPSPDLARLSSVRAPVLGLYGGNDARINARIPATDSAMKALGKTYEHYFFEGAAHGFLRAQEGANGANQKASVEAWPKTVAWFRKHLAG